MLPLISSEVGWLSPSVTTVIVRLLVARTRLPVFGSAGDPAGLPAWNPPCDKAKRLCSRLDVDKEPCT